MSLSATKIERRRYLDIKVGTTAPVLCVSLCASALSRPRTKLRWPELDETHVLRPEQLLRHRLEPRVRDQLHKRRVHGQRLRQHPRVGLPDLDQPVERILGSVELCGGERRFEQCEA